MELSSEDDETALADDSSPCPGVWDRHLSLVHPGHHRQQEHWCPQRNGALGHRLDHPGDWRIHGLELWLSSEPCPRPGPQGLHGSGWVGHGGVQVTNHCPLSL